MGGLGDMLFGSTDEGGYKGSAPLLDPGQQGLLDQLTKLLGGQIGEGMPSYPGKITPGMSPMQGQGMDLIKKLLGGGGVYGTGVEAIDKIMAGPGGGAFNPETATKFWESSVKDPALKMWGEDVLPQIQEHFISQNAGSSGGANRAIARSGEDLASSLTSELSKILFSGEQSQLDRLTSVPGMAGDMATMPINAAMMGGGMERGIEGEQLQELFQKWSGEQGYNNPWLKLLPLLLGTKAVEPIIQQPSSSSGLFQDVFAPLGSAFLGSGGLQDMFGGSGGGGYGAGLFANQSGYSGTGAYQYGR